MVEIISLDVKGKFLLSFGGEGVASQVDVGHFLGYIELEQL